MVLYVRSTRSLIEASQVVSQDLYFFSKALFTAVAFTILLAPSSSSAETEPAPSPLLMSTGEVRKLSRAEMGELNEVRIRGSVAFVSNTWKMLVVHQNGQSIKVGFETELQIPFGTLLEITGKAVPGDLVPVVIATDIQVLANDGLREEFQPVPLKIDASTAFSTDMVNQWVEFEGSGYSAVADDKYYYVSLTGKKFGVYAIIPNSKSMPALERLRGAKLRVSGIPSISVQPGAEGQIDFLVPNSSFIEFIREADDSVDPKLREIVAIGRVDLRDTTEAPARIRAVVRCVSESGRLFIADETGSLMVEPHYNTSIDQLRVGDVVEVEGRIVRNQKHEYISEAKVRYIGKGFSLHPELVSGLEALKRPAELVEIDGTLISTDDHTHGLILKNGIHSFRVHAHKAMSNALKRWSIGSRLRLSGCTWVSEGLDVNFELYPNTVSVIFGLPADINPNKVPDEDTASDAVETLADAVPDNGDDATGLVAAEGSFFWRPQVKLTLQIILIGLAATVALLLQRRFKSQQKFHESIHERLSNLSHIARLNTLSEMVGALAHELNQPLASVSNYAAAAELVSRNKPTDSEKLTGLMNNIGREAFRAGEIIRRLRHLVRKKTPGVLPVQISEIIHETVELFKAQNVIANGLVHVTIADDIPAAQADSVQIQQVLLNLLMNAHDATDAESERPPAIQIDAAYENGVVTVAVSDNGIGIGSPNPDSIFEPYFTTREKGTGLGLAISRTIVETHGGKITAENDLPHGTRITFTLPVSLVRPHIAG
jgi:signal transduction histidine kinase